LLVETTIMRSFYDLHLRTTCLYLMARLGRRYGQMFTSRTTQDACGANWRGLEWRPPPPPTRNERERESASTRFITTEV